jgi:hypothetical protein
VHGGGDTFDSGFVRHSPSGKYWIRMWVMNEWRMVVVDDRVPVDVFGSPLLVNVSRPVMLWPLLYTKAVFKLMHAYRCLEIARPDQVGLPTPSSALVAVWRGLSLPAPPESTVAGADRPASAARPDVHLLHTGADPIPSRRGCGP